MRKNFYSFSSGVGSTAYLPQKSGFRNLYVYSSALNVAFKKLLLVLVDPLLAV